MDQYLKHIQPFKLEEPGSEVDDTICEHFPQSSYQRFSSIWQLTIQNALIKEAHQNLPTTREKTVPIEARERKVIGEIEAALTRLQNSERHLINRGAKTFKEVYPQEDDLSPITYWELEPTKMPGDVKPPWKPIFKFKRSGFEIMENEQYTKL